MGSLTPNPSPKGEGDFEALVTEMRLANDPTIRYTILSLLDGEPKLNSFKILNGEVVNKEVHL